MGDGGFATQATLGLPESVALDSGGNLFILDSWNCRIRKVDGNTGIITTYAGGTGGCGYSGDGGPATKALLQGGGYGMEFDTAGNLLFADRNNNRIRRIEGTTGIITTVAGTGTSGYSGDNGSATAAALSGPFGVAVDSSGNLFIADTRNYRIRKVDSLTGIIKTVAGTGTSGYSGDDGPATAAQLVEPFGVAVDSRGNLFIADVGRVRRIDGKTGIITTIAGVAFGQETGDYGSGTRVRPGTARGLHFDSSGNLILSDSNVATSIIRAVRGDTGSELCVSAIESQTRRHSSMAGSGSISVTTSGSCTWSAVSDSTWLQIAPPGGGTGNGTIGYSVSPNTSALPRSGKITVGETTFLVTQDAGIGVDITTNKAAYVSGDTIAAGEFRIRNSTTSSIQASIRVWLKIPTIGEIDLISFGSDGSFSIPAGVDTNIGLLQLVPVSSTFPPRGNWEFNSRITSPTTGVILSEDINTFVVQ